MRSKSKYAAFSLSHQGRNNNDKKQFFASSQNNKVRMRTIQMLSTLMENIPYRPKSVRYIGFFFIILACVYLAYLLSTGMIQQTVKFDLDGNQIGSGFSLDIVWLLLYGIGAGVLRGGNFARYVACAIGLLALIVPGIIFIRILFFTDAKAYFGNKLCDECGPTKYLNQGFKFKAIKCKTCKRAIELKHD